MLSAPTWSPLAAEIPMWLLVGVPLVFTMVWLWTEGSARAHVEPGAWKKVGFALGLRKIEADRLEGRMRGLDLTVSLVAYGTGTERYQGTVIELRGDLPSGLELSRHARLRRGEVDVGDERFDHTVEVRGDPVAALAALDGEARRRVLDAVEQGWTFDQQRWTLLDSGRMSAARLMEAIKLGLAVAESLKVGRDTPVDRLVERARRDPIEGVRRRALELLAGYFRSTPAAREVLQEAATSPAPELRLLAAKALGAPDLLAALARGERGEPTVVRDEALGALVEGHPEAAETHAALGERLATFEGATREARLRSLELLGRVHHPEAEALLIGLLGDEADEDERLAAVAALGRQGGVTAVAALLPLRERVFSFTLKRAAQDAIRAIQARAERAEAGGLSLAAEGGGLALHDERAAARSPMVEEA